MSETSSRGTKTYSKYYDTGEWIQKNKIGITFVVEHQKTEIPVIYGLQRSIGALGPDDMKADGRVTVTVVNATEQNHQIKIERVVVGRQELQIPVKTTKLTPKSTTSGTIGTAVISNYGTEIPINAYYELDGKKGSIELKLPRRTYQELKAYYGPKGNPPYPWFKQQQSSEF